MTNQARSGLALASGLMLAAGVVARRWRRLEVVGDSMVPTLLAGDRVVVWRGWRLRPGDLVALSDPVRPGSLIVKRVASVSGGEIVVLGDNTAVSVDSRYFGPIRSEALLGRVVYRYAPGSRAGRLGPTATRW